MRYCLYFVYDLLRQTNLTSREIAVQLHLWEAHGRHRLSRDSARFVSIYTDSVRQSIYKVRRIIHNNIKVEQNFELYCKPSVGWRWGGGVYQILKDVFWTYLISLSLFPSCTFKVTLVVVAIVFVQYYIYNSCILALIMDPFQTSF